MAPDYETLYPGRFLKGQILDRPRVIRITKVTGTMLEGDKGEEAKCIVTYKSNFTIEEGRVVDGKVSTGEIVWCKSNSALLAAMTGTRDYDEWVGKLVTIWFDPSVKFGREQVGGIRVYGSPELTETKRVNVKRPRKKTPDVYTLRPTDKQGRDIKPNGKPQPPSREPGSDDGPIPGEYDDAPPPDMEGF
jgi:hypothetical protein